MQQAVTDHLKDEVTRASASVRKHLVDIAGVLERVKGISCWLDRDLALIKWCQEMLQEAELPAPFFKASDNEVSHG